MKLIESLGKVKNSIGKYSSRISNFMTKERFSGLEKLIIPSMFAAPLLGAVIALSQPCCVDDGKETARTEYREDNSDDDQVYGDVNNSDDSGEAGDDTCFSDYDSETQPFNVTHCKDLGRNEACEKGEDILISPCNCNKDYLEFTSIASEFSRPTTLEDIDAYIQPIINGEVPLFEEDMTFDQLRSLLYEELNLSFLMDDLNSRELKITTIFEEEKKGFLERHLEISDPYLGKYNAIFLEPTGFDEPPPVIVTLHGHTFGAWDFYYNKFATEYPLMGYSIIIPDKRSMCGDAMIGGEQETTKHLLERGFPFVGLRVYETNLLLKYLKSLGYSSFGMICHSGGCSESTLVLNMGNEFRAYVRDNESEYLPRINSPPGYIFHEELVPPIWQYHRQINDLLYGIPVLNIPYDYFDAAKEEIFIFLDQNMKN